MSYIVSPFEVVSKAIGSPAKVHFLHLYSANTTRHSDSMDAVYLVNGQNVTVAVSCATLADLRATEHKVFGDQQIVDVATLYLRRSLEKGCEPSGAELFLNGSEFEALARELRYL